jgi:hypothetical protein
LEWTENPNGIAAWRGMPVKVFLCVQQTERVLELWPRMEGKKNVLPSDLGVAQSPVPSSRTIE